VSSLHDSSVGDFTRGGQVLIHFLRMIGQVLRKFGAALLVLYSLLTVGLWFAQTDAYARYLGIRYVGTSLGMMLGNGANEISVALRDGRLARTTVAQFDASRNMRANVELLVRWWLVSMVLSAAVMTLFLAGFLAWLFRFGAAQRRESIVRGGSVVAASDLSVHLRRAGRASELRVADVPLILDSETSHILLTGSPGTGKTTSIHALMSAIRRRGDRCICYSPSGDFIEWFHRPDRDRALPAIW
jgi:hypothetical protein